MGINIFTIIAGEFDLHVKEGQKIQANSIADLVLKKGCRTEAVTR